MGTSALRLVKDLFSRDPVNRALKRLQALHDTYRFTPPDREWIEKHRKKHDRESKELDLKFIEEEIKYIESKYGR